MEAELRDSQVQFWIDEIDAYEREAAAWETRSRKIVKRYKDNRQSKDGEERFNILWSNVETLLPATYSNLPVPNVDRRFQDDDELGNTVAQILERCVAYYTQTDDFDDVMNQSVLDRLLSGRGTAWVRYVPNFVDAQIEGNEEIKQEGAQVTDDVMIADEAETQETELYSEDVVVDYVNWCDFGHSVSRTWQECRAAWRRVYMGRAELKERFPETAFRDGRLVLPLDSTNKKQKNSDDGESESGKKACIYEIWDKVTKKVYWLHKDVNWLLDERDDPLRIKGFFPFPKPLFATLSNDSLIPVPDFALYQDQAIELDTLTRRISSLTRALKVAGVYDGNAQGVENLLTENAENVLIPVNDWAMFAEKGGLAGVVNWFPVDQVAAVLVQLYQARDKIKQDIYEITGISDIVRGATNASETATAQQIKGQFANLRLGSRQKQAARFSRELVRIMAEIIAEHFSIETIKQISGVKLLSDQEKQLIQMGMQGGIQPPEEIANLMAKPTWEQVQELLRNDAILCFKVDIETDSTIKADQEAEKAARTEFLNAAGSFIQQAVQVQNPDLQPLLMQMLMFGVRGFKVGREMEATFKLAMDKIDKQAEAQQQPDNSEALRAQAEMQAKQQEAEMKAQRDQQEFELRNREIALREREAIESARQENIKLELEKMRIQLEMINASKPADPETGNSEAISAILAQGLSAIAQAQNEGNAAVVQAIQNQPARVVVRDNSEG